MITAFICNIEIDRNFLNKFKESWLIGPSPINTPKKDNPNSFYMSDARNRVDNFPAPMIPYLYGINSKKEKTDPVRFYIKIEREVSNVNIKWLDILMVGETLIKSEQIPAQICLVTDIEGDIHKVQNTINKLSRSNKIYEVIKKLNITGLLLPGSKLSSDSLRKKVYHICYSESKLHISEINNIKNPILSEIFTTYSLATSRNPSDHQIARWSDKKPSEYYKLSKDWGIYIARHGACYYISPGFKYGIPYATGFHLDGFIFIMLQEHIIEFYESQMVNLITHKEAREAKLDNQVKNILLLQKEIQENNMRYRFNNHISHTGQHISIMNLTYKTRNFEDILISFTKDAESLTEISSKIHDLNINKQQEYISRYALYIALLMILPGIVGGINDSTSVVSSINGIFMPPENSQSQSPLILFFGVIILNFLIALPIYLIYKYIRKK